MKVSELIKQLKKLPKDSIVILSSDAEGNKFSPVSYLSKALYAPEGDVYNLDEDKNDLPDDAVTAVVIWPTN